MAVALSAPPTIPRGETWNGGAQLPLWCWHQTKPVSSSRWQCANRVDMRMFFAGEGCAPALRQLMSPDKQTNH